MRFSFCLDKGTSYSQVEIRACGHKANRCVIPKTISYLSAFCAIVICHERPKKFLH